MSIFHDIYTWHRRLGYTNFELLNDLSKNELVDRLPKLKFTKDKTCYACQKENKLSHLLNSKIKCQPLDHYS